MPADFRDLIERQDWFEPTGMVTVTPRHIVGPGRDADRLITEFFLDRGWQENEDRLTRPCGRLGIHRPTDTAHQWTVWGAQHRGAEIAWSLTVTTAIPPEILAATVVEAEAVLDEDPHTREPFVRGILALGVIPLARAGWTDDATPRGAVTFRPPDGYANALVNVPSALHELRGKPAAKVSSYGPNSYWEAEFTAGTPSRILGAFTRELADPEPLVRTADFRDLRFTVKHVTIRPLIPETDEQLSPAAQAARSRSTTPATTPAPASTAPSADTVHVAAEPEPSGRSR
ncbi:DUF317 domain-containing protein [Kitasatospora sp. NPDC057015]|uniref:DUF317 domain-containing protein n=1 Tax=Kitasatospora sp. NPDC057015 TaxID=3346001 RepID=UPI0036365C22